MNRLLPHALLGTQRSNIPETELDYISKAAASPEAALLSLAGALSLRARVGAQPQHFITSPQGVATESKPQCKRDIASYLHLILEGVYPDLLPDVVSALAEAELRIPALFIPEMLDRGLKRYLLRGDIIRIIGNTGRWLATQNPDWRYAAPDFDSWDAVREEWAAQVPSRRQGALYQLRQRDPDGARALLKSTWQRETTSPLWTLRLLEPTLTLQDEPFLERALDHRNLSVRRKAADLLARLPESRLCQRMTAWVSDILSYRARLKRIEVNFPGTLPPELLRDGVLLRKWKDETKVRHAQLVDMVSAVPLDYWLETWKVSPNTLVHAAVNSDWHVPLLRAFASAAERQKRADLAFELVKRTGLGASTQKLVSVLEAGQVLELAAAFASDLAAAPEFPERKAAATAFVKLLSRWTNPWSPELLEVFLSALPEICRFEAERVAEAKLKQMNFTLGSSLIKTTQPLRKRAVTTNTVTVRNLLRQAARRTPPELAPAIAEALLEAVSDSSYPQAQEAAELLTFRAGFYRALAAQGESK